MLITVIDTHDLKDDLIKGRRKDRDGKKPGFWLLSQPCRMSGDKLCQCKEKKNMRRTKKEACNSTDS